MGRPADTVVIRNRRARYDYLVLDSFECGIVLAGSEVKSIRAGRANLQDAYARVEDGEVWLHGMHVAPYEFSRAELEPTRRRKLLLHRKQIDELARATGEKGVTLVPLRVYFKDGRAKVELAVAKGKRTTTSGGRSPSVTPSARPSARSRGCATDGLARRERLGWGRARSRSSPSYTSVYGLRPTHGSRGDVGEQVVGVRDTDRRQRHREVLHAAHRPLERRCHAQLVDAHESGNGTVEPLDRPRPGLSRGAPPPGGMCPR